MLGTYIVVTVIIGGDMFRGDICFMNEQNAAVLAESFREDICPTGGWSSHPDSRLGLASGNKTTFQVRER